MDVVIVGASGHGMVVCDALLLQGRRVLAFIDADVAKQGSRVLDIPVVAGISQVPQPPAALRFVDGNWRQRCPSSRIRTLAFRWHEILGVPHPSASGSTWARIGVGQSSWPRRGECRGRDRRQRHSQFELQRRSPLRDWRAYPIAPAATLAGNVRVGSDT